MKDFPPVAESSPDVRRAAESEVGQNSRRTHNEQRTWRCLSRTGRKLPADGARMQQGKPTTEGKH